MADKDAKFNFYTVMEDMFDAPPHKVTGDNNIYTVLGLKPKKVKKQMQEPEIMNLDKITLDLTQAIEGKKVKTADLASQFDAVEGNTQVTEKERAEQERKEQQEAEISKNMAEAARQNPGAIGMSFAGPDASRAGRDQADSRIKSRGKSKRHSSL